MTEATQASYLAQTATLVRQQMPYVTRMYWYTDRDIASGGIQDANYGLFRRDLSGKPALAAAGDGQRQGGEHARQHPDGVNSTGQRTG